jgi:hypothetical protein
MADEKEKLKKALAFIKELAEGMDPNHRAYRGRWEWGDYDDSFDHGFACGEQAVFRDAARLLNELKGSD